MIFLIVGVAKSECALKREKPTRGNGLVRVDVGRADEWPSMAVVTVLFSPSLCPESASCTRHVARDVSVGSFLALLHRDFKFHRCTEELEAYIMPASYLWLGDVGINNKMCGRNRQLLGKDRLLLPLLSEALGDVLLVLGREGGCEGKVSEGWVREGGKEGEGGCEDESLVRERGTEGEGGDLGREGKGEGETDEADLSADERVPTDRVVEENVKKEVLQLRKSAAGCQAEYTPLSGLVSSEVVELKTDPFCEGMTDKRVQSAGDSDTSEVKEEVYIPTIWVSDTESESDVSFNTRPECLPGLKKFSSKLRMLPRSPHLQPPPSAALLSETGENKPADMSVLSESEFLEDKTIGWRGEMNEITETDSAFNSTIDSALTIESSPSPETTPPGLLTVCIPSLEGVVRVTGEPAGGLMEEEVVRREVRDGEEEVVRKEVRDGEEEGVDEGIGMDVVMGSDSGDGGSVIVVTSDDDDDDYKLERCSRMEQSHIVHCCGMELSHTDLNTLLPNRWLNDQVVNCYMKLLMRERPLSSGVFIANTFFYTKLCRSGIGSVDRWMKNVDFTKLCLFVVPVHLGNHWCLATAHLKRKVISYYDSLGGHNPLCMKKILQFVLHRMYKCTKSSIRETARGSPSLLYSHYPLKAKHWRKCYPKALPRQIGSSDCGVFVCQFARWLCSNPGQPHSSVPFRQSHIYRIRQVMMQELEHGKLVHMDFITPDF